jgi:hypothetical protein
VERDIYMYKTRGRGCSTLSRGTNGESVATMDFSSAVLPSRFNGDRARARLLPDHDNPAYKLKKEGRE